jgi:hypothetical protein
MLSLKSHKSDSRVAISLSTNRKWHGGRGEKSGIGIDKH